jgi:hypothetical protein
MMRTEKMTMLALGLCGVTSLAGCGSSNDGPSSDSTESQESVGSVGLQLQMANGAIIDSAS